MSPLFSKTLHIESLRVLV